MERMLYFIPVHGNTRLRLMLSSVGVSGNNDMCMVYSLEGKLKKYVKICL